MMTAPKITDFSRWWRLVPNKVGKQKAATAYAKAIKTIRNRHPDDGPGGDDPHGYLAERMTAFAASPKAHSEYVPHPATWLNEGRYDDDPAMWQKGAVGKVQRGPELDPVKAQQWKP